MPLVFSWNIKNGRFRRPIIRVRSQLCFKTIFLCLLNMNCLKPEFFPRNGSRMPRNAWKYIKEKKMVDCEIVSRRKFALACNTFLSKLLFRAGNIQTHGVLRDKVYSILSCRYSMVLKTIDWTVLFIKICNYIRES